MKKPSVVCLSLQYLPMLLEHLTKSEMSEGDYSATVGLINSLMGLEKQNVSLPVTNSAARPTKKYDQICQWQPLDQSVTELALFRDEQYKLMWSEMAELTTLFAGQSGRHKAVDILVKAFKNQQAPPANLDNIIK